MSDTEHFGVCPKNDSTGANRYPQFEKSQTATTSEDVAIVHDPEKHHSFTASEENTLAGITNNGEAPQTHSILAYLIVPASFFIWFNSWGAINAFGVFQTHYQLSLLSSYSPSTIASIGSVQNWLVLFVGFLSGPLYDAGYAPALVCGGALLTVLGKMLLSLASNEAYYEVFLAQGVCVGVGWGLMFAPAASMPGTYWKGKKLGMATGLGSAGTSVGGKLFLSLAAVGCWGGIVLTEEWIFRIGLLSHFQPATSASRYWFSLGYEILGFPRLRNIGAVLHRDECRKLEA